MSDNEAPQSTQFERVIWAVITTLIAGGVIGLWTMASTVTRLDERVALWTKIYETRFEGLSSEQRDFRTRLERLERRDAARTGNTP